MMSSVSSPILTSYLPLVQNCESFKQWWKKRALPGPREESPIAAVNWVLRDSYITATRAGSLSVEPAEFACRIDSSTRH